MRTRTIIPALIILGLCGFAVNATADESKIRRYRVGETQHG